jgi:hypothetical protein
MLYYKNGLSEGRHTVRISAITDRNPLSRGTRTQIDQVQSSAAQGNSGFGSGGGPTGAQRMIFGYPSRTDHVDSAGNVWRPGTEFVVRTGKLTDSVAKTWWTLKRAIFVEDTLDRELYQYGAHAPEFIVNLTVGPGTYHVRLKFAETEYTGPDQRAFSIYVNGNQAIGKMDVFARAGKANKAVDAVFDNIMPRNGVIEIRLKGEPVNGRQSEAILQAVEVTP